MRHGFAGSNRDGIASCAIPGEGLTAEGREQARALRRLLAAEEIGVALTSRLAILQDAGLMVRDPPEGKRARYCLTESAHALGPVYNEVARWSIAHLYAEGETTPGWPPKIG